MPVKFRCRLCGTGGELHRATFHVSRPKKDPESTTIRVCDACISNIIDHP